MNNIELVQVLDTVQYLQSDITYHTLMHLDFHLSNLCKVASIAIFKEEENVIILPFFLNKFYNIWMINFPQVVDFTIQIS